MIIRAEREWLVRSDERLVRTIGTRSTAICVAVLAAHASQHQEGRTQVIMVTETYEAYPIWTSGFGRVTASTRARTNGVPRQMH
jgi:hypothetical protein